MELITIQSQILEVAKRWKRQYWQDGKADKMEILKKLENTNLKTATAEDIENIIGNSSWACAQRCHECDKYFNVIVEVGEEPDYESSTACLCISCIKKALKLSKSNLNP